MSPVPEPLRWAALITGTQLPEADPALLRQQGEVWAGLAQQVQGMMSEVNSVRTSVLSNVNGQPAEAFDAYMRTLGTTLPELAKAADNLRLRADEFALEVEHATYMVEAMLAWMLIELAFLANTLFGLAAVPALITGVRQVIQAILRRLVMSAAIGAASMTGLETLLQAIEILKGTRKHLDPNAIKNMALGGVIGGAAFGALSGVASHFVPKFANSLIGRTAIGGASGVVGGAAVNAALGAQQDLGLAFLAGAAGAMLGAPGGGGRRQDTRPTEGLADAVKSLTTKAPFSPPEGVNGTDLPGLGGSAGASGGIKDLTTPVPGSAGSGTGAPRNTATPGPDAVTGTHGAVRTEAPAPDAGRPPSEAPSSAPETRTPSPETAVPAPATAAAGGGTARDAAAPAPASPRPSVGLPGFEEAGPAAATTPGGPTSRPVAPGPAATGQVREVPDPVRTPSQAGPTAEGTPPPVIRTGATAEGTPAPETGGTPDGGALPGRIAESGPGAPETGALSAPAAVGDGVRGAEGVAGAGGGPDRTVGGAHAEPSGTVGTQGAPGSARPGATDAAPAATARPDGAARGTGAPAPTAADAIAKPPVTTQSGNPATSGPGTRAGVTGGAGAPEVRTVAGPGAGGDARPGEGSASGVRAGADPVSVREVPASGEPEARAGVTGGAGAPVVRTEAGPGAGGSVRPGEGSGSGVSPGAGTRPDVPGGASASAVRAAGDPATTREEPVTRPVTTVRADGGSRPGTTGQPGAPVRGDGTAGTGSARPDAVARQSGEVRPGAAAQPGAAVRAGGSRARV
ncbi:hypothetical protein ABZX30_36390 [Streptomyces sp. NPDC004542]|uniref:WXG100-like domain-containing protein n=1 Tax=Streptomyces sp. NPDC004542 TaxID=3154281 RepID=UPI0033B43399